MAKELVAFRGRAKGLLAGLVLIVIAMTYVAPGVLAQLNLAAGYGWSLLRLGHRETHLVNRTGHWLGTTSDYKRSGPAFAFAGERLVIDYGIEPDEGGVGLSLVSLTLPFLLIDEHVWSHRIREEEHGQVTIEVPETGFYNVRMSFFRFGGSAEVDWTIR